MLSRLATVVGYHVLTGIVILVFIVLVLVAVDLILKK